MSGGERTLISAVLGLACAAAATPGCYKSDWEQAQRDIADLRAELADRDARIGQDSERLAALSAEREDLRRNLDALNARFAQDTGQLRANLEELQRAFDEARRLQEQQAARLAAYRRTYERFRAMIEAGRLRVRFDRGRMVVEMASAILFPSGSAELSELGQRTISELAAILSGIHDRSFQIAGHTDNVPISSARYRSNWELSTARALTVVRFLQDVGVDATRLAAVGYGEHQPIADNATEDGRANNRRIEVILMPNLDELPDLSSLEAGIPPR